MAIQFDLLPWREEKRQKRQRDTRNALVLAAVLGGGLGLGYYSWEKLRLSDHNKALQNVTHENKLLTPKLAEEKKLQKLKNQLNLQIDAIESLQADRASVSHMVEELSNANKQDLFLTGFRLKDGKVNIAGIAKNDTQIADLMKRLRASEWYQEPKLLEIVTKSEFGDEIKAFSITSNLLLPGRDEMKKGLGHGKKN